MSYVHLRLLLLLLRRTALPFFTIKLPTVRRHHVRQASQQMAFKTAVGKAGITKNASVHTVANIFDIAPS